MGQTVLEAVLADAGWLFWPDDPCRHYRLWFLRPSPEARTHHLHVIERRHAHATALVAFLATLHPPGQTPARNAALEESQTPAASPQR